MMDADYADEIALLAKIPGQAESLLHSLEQAAGDIGLHINANKTVYMCFNREGAISTQNGAPLILVDKFTYLSSRISSTESVVSICLVKAWIAIDRLSNVWKSNLSDEKKKKRKSNYFQASVISILIYGCSTWTLPKCQEEKLDWNRTRML